MEKDSFPAASAGKTHTSTWAIILIAVAALRIGATCTVFSETIDEAAHFSGGMQVIEQHRYDVQRLNPPLPRLLFAMLPHLDGTRYTEHVYENIGEVFQSPRGYRRTLALGRFGNLIFFIIAAIATWMWARREIGDNGATAALFLFTTQPIVLGYSGLMTHDTSAIAGVALSILALRRWIDAPTAANAALLGAAYGFGAACKFSCIPFIPAACAAILIVRIRTLRWKPMLLTLPLVPIVAAAVVWASYGFTIHAFLDGMRAMIAINQGEAYTYFFGRISTHGFLLYFPVAVLLKTTLASLMFVVASLFAPQKRVVAECLLATAAMLAVSMTSPLDLGVRYILPVFVPLSVAAGAGLVAMWERRRAAAAVLIAWQLVASLVAHPDYFPYFNELGGREPGRFLIDSNIDWGQDLLRLSKALRRRHVQHIGISIFTNADLDALHFPQRHRLNGYAPDSGWMAISEHMYQMDGARGAWFWLKGQPYHRVGKSIRIYNINAGSR